MRCVKCKSTEFTKINEIPVCSNGHEMLNFTLEESQQDADGTFQKRHVKRKQKVSVLNRNSSHQSTRKNNVSFQLLISVFIFSLKTQSDAVSKLFNLSDFSNLVLLKFKQVYKTAIIQPPLTLALIFSQLSNLMPISIPDLINLVKKGDIPYLSCLLNLPIELKNQLTNSSTYHISITRLQPNSIPSIHTILKFLAIIKHKVIALDSHRCNLISSLNCGMFIYKYSKLIQYLVKGFSYKATSSSEMAASVVIAIKLNNSQFYINDKDGINSNFNSFLAFMDKEIMVQAKDQALRNSFIDIVPLEIDEDESPIQQTRYVLNMLQTEYRVNSKYKDHMGIHPFPYQILLNHICTSVGIELRALERDIDEMELKLSKLAKTL